MAGNKRHLVVKTSTGRTACGIHRPRRSTLLHHHVTCHGCLRTEHAALAAAVSNQQFND